MEEANSRPVENETESVETSKRFVIALQELKNLRPQLYSAADYCEKSYLQSDQKKVVMSNLKDYTLRALVNAVDHLGTVAYKLTDILDQQALDISSIGLKLTSLNQQLLTCQSYTDKEVIRQQQLLAIIPRHHKHYILPNSVNKKVHFSPHVQTDPRQQVRARLYPSGASAAKTLSWQLASETNSTLRGSPFGIMSSEDTKTNGHSGAFASLDAENNTKMKSTPASRAAMKTLGVTRRDPSESSRPLNPYNSFDSPAERQIVRTPVRSKSMLSSFFVKQKTPRLKTNA